MTSPRLPTADCPLPTAHSPLPTALTGWDRLRHAGLLLDAQRLREVAAQAPGPLSVFHERELRRQAATLMDDSGEAAAFVAFVLEDLCGFTRSTGNWQRGTQVPSEWGRPAVTGETVKPRHLWQGRAGGVLPVFLDREKRIGIGRGRKATSQVLQWLRAGSERLALLTNGRQWRLVFAGLDFDAWCEWDVDLWFEEGALSSQIDALRTLLAPSLWTPAAKDTLAPLLRAVFDSRKGQADLSQKLGERVREAVEILVQGHGEALKECCANVSPADIYRAAVRVIMRLVVALFAESRELLPRDNALYHGAYGVTGLLEEMEKTAARGGSRLTRSWSAWPRVLALFRLIHQGSHHPDLPVLAYGGELFAPGDPESSDGLGRALAVFENACFDQEVLPDRDVHRILDRVTRTRVKVRQGHVSTWMPAPVDFSDLSSEYIGILYEGLLDFELRTAPDGDPILFLAVGNQPALPLKQLEEMDDKALANLLERMKDTNEDEEGNGQLALGNGEDDDSSGESGVGSGQEEEDETDDSFEENSIADYPLPAAPSDERHTTRTRAETWARRVVEIGKLVRKPKGTMTPEKRLIYDEAVSRKARQLVVRVILPGEWYLVRWGGTRKGSGTYYTKPALAVPTVQRTLRPLAYEPPAGSDGMPELEAHPSCWTPKTPAEILALKVCDPACGSGSFLLAALRFLTEALYVSLHHHGCIRVDGDRSIVRLLGGDDAPDHLSEELLPCRPDDPLFESRLKAILRRHVVERCIYGVDLDRLSVELCRMALWIETMDRTLPFTFLKHKVRRGDALVGTWFDRFRDYPLLAWWRQSPDEKWRGVTHEGDTWAEALKEKRKQVVAEQVDLLTGQKNWLAPPVSDEELRAAVERVRELYQQMHDVPASRPDERARIWREEVSGDPALDHVREAFDAWCALWFWPLDRLADAPGPASLPAPSEAAREVVRDLRERRHFFHWELEFPDVFDAPGAGFDAIVANPPWEVRKPSSKEFFSELDPLYRSYGKQEALRRQRELFAADASVERKWLDHVAVLKDAGNFVRNAAEPYGNANDAQGRPLVGLVPRQADETKRLHIQWAAQRGKKTGLSDPEHAFRHQGSADLNSYKLFVEQAYALLRPGGQLGLVTPSGLYTDKGSGDLRRLLLDRCAWRWLYGFENRNKIFDIDSRFKFAVTIAQKGSHTEALHAAFMRHELEDWAEAKGSLAYPAERIHVFSPKSFSVVEIQSERDLDVLTRIYANSVLLGDDSPDGWGIRYATEFHMTNDSKLFIPREKAEEAGYKPDEYGRWIGPDGDVLLPLYEGRMIGQFDFSEKGWVQGKGRSAEWRVIPWDNKTIEPQFLMRMGDFNAALQRKPTEERIEGQKATFMGIGSATNRRSMFSTAVRDMPCGNAVPIMQPAKVTNGVLGLTASLNSFTYDFTLRLRLGGLNLNYFVIEETPLLRPQFNRQVELPVAALAWSHAWFSPDWLVLRSGDGVVLHRWAITPHERLRLRSILDAIVAALYGLSRDDLRWILRDCDHPREQLAEKAFCRKLDPKGFWRVDKDHDPELRHTVLTLIAFDALERHIADAGGDRDRGIASFSVLNGGEGWMLPETLRLADHGLGHDDRARHPQTVASRLGPRFLDWQLAQTPEESWAECERHARAILGDEEYERRFNPSGERKASDVGSAIAIVPPVKEKPGAPVTQQIPLFGQAEVSSEARIILEIRTEPMPMTLSRIRLLNFRNWTDEHWTSGIDLRPITLVLGRNSAGKTSILQPLRMLKQTIEATDAGIHLHLGAGLAEGVDLGAFVDVINGHDESRELGVGIDLAEKEISVDVRFRQVAERPVIESLAYRIRDEKIEISRTPNAYQLRSPRFRLPNWDGAKDVHEPKKVYEPGRGITVSENALSDLGPSLGPQVRKAMLAFKDAFRTFHYLGPLRPPPAREVTWMQQDPTRLGSTGSETVQALIGSATRRETSTLLANVSAWLKRLDLADSIEVRRLGSSLLYQIEVIRGGDRSNLIDVGYGVSQVLPVIVLLHFVPEGAVILCEGPEAHLHPMAQASMADMFVEVARKRRLQILLETHSEHLFRRLQYLISEGRVRSTDCALYYVERDEPSAKLIVLESDEFGRVKNWPDMLFGDAIGEVERQTMKALERMKEKKTRG